MPSAEEMFEHLYRDGIRELEWNEAQNEKQLKDLQSTTPPIAGPRLDVIMLTQYGNMIRNVINNLKVERPDPQLVFRKGLSALKTIEEFRFILENLLEAVKHGDSLQNTLRRYGSEELKLLEDWGLGEVPEETEKNSPWRSNIGVGTFLRKMWGGLRKAALTVMDLVTEAIALIPQLATVKPKASIGITGPFPTFDLQFEIEGPSFTIHELFQALAQ
jgi:hypothetical protein